jgi:alkaline phosphatase
MFTVYLTILGDDVPIYASGPKSHMFVGNYEQNYIPYLISYAAEIGEYNANPQQTCTKDDSNGTVSFQISITLMIIISFWQFLVHH